MFSLRRSLVELLKRRNLQNLSPFSNSFSSAINITSPDPQKGQTFTVAYLIDSLGLTTKLAESISKKVSFNEKANPDSILNLLKTHGFIDSQISNIITDYPLLLVSNPEKSVGPKLEFLQSRGASSSEYTEVISKFPQILGKDRSFSIYYDFVKEVLEADKSSKFKTLHTSLPQGSKQDNKIRNLSILRDLGMPQELLFPLLISNSPYVCGKEKFEESLKQVLEIGFDPRTSKFLEALRIIYGLKKEIIQEKLKISQRLGFCEDDIWTMFKKFPKFLTLSEKKITRNFETMKKYGFLEDEICSVVKRFPQFIGVSEQKIENSFETFLGLGFSKDEFALMVKRVPTCIGYSDEMVKKKTEFVVKHMDWSLKAMVTNPQVLGYSLEKRIIPRCNVIKALMFKGLIGNEVPRMSSVLVCTDHDFLNRYVKKVDDKDLVSELMTIFVGVSETDKVGV